MFDRVVLIIGLREIPSSCGTREVEDSEGKRKSSKVYRHRLFHLDQEWDIAEAAFTSAQYNRDLCFNLHTEYLFVDL